MIIINKKTDGYNHGLGCRQRDVKETLRRIEGETGRRLEEVGNESAGVRRKASTYEFTAKDLAGIKEELKGVEGD